jgi:hypothetical protein
LRADAFAISPRILSTGQFAKRRVAFGGTLLTNRRGCVDFTRREKPLDNDASLRPQKKEIDLKVNT